MRQNFANSAVPHNLRQVRGKFGEFSAARVRRIFVQLAAIGGDFLNYVGFVLESCPNITL